MTKYEYCKQLKELGLYQKHNRYSKYYLTEDYIIDFQTAHDVFQSNIKKENGELDEIEWSKTLIYIPTLEDFYGGLSNECWETLAQNYIKEHGGTKE